MASANYVGIAVPFTVDEIENLSTLATAQGGSIVDFIRARVFSPIEARPERFTRPDKDMTTEDLTTMMARIEGMRIRARGRHRE